MPAAVNRPVIGPVARSTRSLTAASTASVSARSAKACAASALGPLGGFLSMIRGVPPCRVTASAVAAPRPDAPPVMMTLPMPGRFVVSLM